jgi:hypothetical protein
VRLPADAPLPVWAARPSGLASATRTTDELSLVVGEALVPEGSLAERGWVAFRVTGTLDFGLTGILAELTRPLAAARVSIFALSTYDTDYLLVKDAAMSTARTALEAAGHTFTT